jgi:hypothetical protein
MIDDHPRTRVHPSPGRHADPEYRPVSAVTASPVGPGGERRQLPRDPAEHLTRVWRGAMRDPFPRDNPPAQVNQRQRGMPRSDVYPAHDRPLGVDIHRHMRTAVSSPVTPRLGGLVPSPQTPLEGGRRRTRRPPQRRLTRWRLPARTALARTALARALRDLPQQAAPDQLSALPAYRRGA